MILVKPNSEYTHHNISPGRFDLGENQLTEGGSDLILYIRSGFSGLASVEFDHLIYDIQHQPPICGLFLRVTPIEDGRWVNSDIVYEVCKEASRIFETLTRYRGMKMSCFRGGDISFLVIRENLESELIPELTKLDKEWWFEVVAKVFETLTK